MADAFASELLLNTAAAARQLGVSPSFLAKARMQGVGPRYRKLGRAVRYAHADLDHWLRGCSRTSTTEQPAVAGLIPKASAEPGHPREFPAATRLSKRSRSARGPP